MDNSLHLPDEIVIRILFYRIVDELPRLLPKARTVMNATGDEVECDWLRKLEEEFIHDQQEVFIKQFTRRILRPIALTGVQWHDCASYVRQKMIQDHKRKRPQ